MSTDKRACGENLSWSSLARCGKPAEWVVRGKIVMYRCSRHAQRYLRPGYTVKAMPDVH